jgi:hypothetical protein
MYSYFCKQVCMYLVQINVTRKGTYNIYFFNLRHTDLLTQLSLSKDIFDR